MTSEKLDKLKNIKAFQTMPTVLSKDTEWINWMKTLDKTFDRNTSVSLFMNLWNKRGTAEARTLQLRQFMKDKYNVDLSENIVDKVVDLGGGIADTVASIAKIGKISFFVIGGVILTATGVAIYNIFKNPGRVSMLTPQGRTFKMIKR